MIIEKDSTGQRDVAPIIDIPPKTEGYFTFHEDAYADMLSNLSKWEAQAISKHAEPEQAGQQSPNGEGIHYEALTLYFGADTPGIQQLRGVGETSFGSGLYATAVPKKAFAYAFSRAGNHDDVPEIQPAVYELEVRDMTFFDARDKDNLAAMLDTFGDVVEAELKQEKPFGVEGERGEIFWDEDFGLQALVENIRANKFSEVHGNRGLARVAGEFTAFLSDYGYDGVVVAENEHNTGSHDSYVLFKPEKAKITDSITMKRFNTIDPRTRDFNWILEDQAKQGNWWER